MFLIYYEVLGVLDFEIKQEYKQRVYRLDGGNKSIGFFL